MIATQEAAIDAAERRLKESQLSQYDLLRLMARMLEPLKQ